MKLTTNHSASSYGVPVFLDGDGNPMDYAPALRQLRKDKGWSVAYVAGLCGVSKRTAEGWEQGRLPSNSALIALSQFIND